MSKDPPTASSPKLDELVREATTLLAALEHAPETQSEDSLRTVAAQALALVTALAGDTHAFVLLDQRLPESRLIERLLELPRQLAAAKQVQSALELVRALGFISPDLMRGDEALILANAGLREQALALVASNLAQAKDIPTAEAKAGDVYRALGEADAAEAYYRRSLAESRSALERSEAILRIVSLLSDEGREQDAADFLSQERERQAERPEPGRASFAKVGRNEPCPCGSGKKYKKCHGTEA